MNEENIAEFIGVMLGDGSIGVYNTKAGNKIKKHPVVKVTLDSRNKEYTDYVFNLMKEVLNVEPRVYFKKTENTVDICTFKKDRLDFVINKIGLKLSPKWDNMEIPKKYFQEKFYQFILRGLFDTDGSVTVFHNNGVRYPRIEIKICPSPAQNQIKEILNSLKFRYKIQNLDKGEIRIRISGVNELKRWFEIVGSSNAIHIEKQQSFYKEKALKTISLSTLGFG